MSELLVSIPLKLLRGAELTAEGISKALEEMPKELERQRDRADRAEAKVENLKGVVRNYGKSIMHILESGDTQMVIAKRLRSILGDMQTYG